MTGAWARAVPWVLLAGGLALVLPGLTYRLHVDAISYFGIADHYAAGRWAEAVNGYWGPLLSWLLAPLQAAGLDGFTAFKMVNAGAALGTLAAFRALLRRLDVREPTLLLSSVAVSPFLVYAAAAIVSPDLLLAAAVLAYVAVVTGSADPPTAAAGRCAGLLGGLAYLTKAFGLPFFLAHFLLVNVVRLFTAGTRARRRAVVEHASWGLAVAGAIAGLWVGVLSSTYGELVISSAATQNLAWVMPGSGTDPTGTLGLVEPPSPHALSAFEDPALLPDRSHAEAASPGRSMSEEMADRVGVVVGNLRQGAQSLGRGWGLMVLAVVAAVTLSIWQRRPVGMTSSERVVAAAVVVYGSGVLASHMEGRYLWSAFLLLVVLAARMAGSTLAHVGTTWVRSAAAVVMLTALAVPPTAPLADRLRYTNPSMELAQQAEVQEALHGRVASNAAYAESLVVCYYAGCRYFGSLQQPHDRVASARELTEHGIDYLLVWGDPPPALPPATARRFGGEGGVQVFDVR